MKKAIIVWFACVFFSATVAAAEPGGYLGVQIASEGTYDDGAGGEANPGLIVFRGGMMLNPVFGIEARYGTGTSDDTFYSGPNAGVNLKLDSLLGAYAIGKLPLGEVFELYGALGYTRLAMTFSQGSTTVSADGSSPSYGLGANLRWERWSAGIEFMRYYDKGGESFTVSSSATVTFHF